MRRIAIDVQGIVQGVGFRPYVYRLASRLNLTGIVLNNPDGVRIEVQGKPESVTSFVNQLQPQAPPLAQITSLTEQEIAFKDEQRFEIVISQAASARRTLISPDIASCPECLAELNAPSDRRYHYPFINCTNCGPRYTIITDIPYDRPKTTMAGFKMCPDCQREYDNPADRRFHAQPNACAVCGPEIYFATDRIRIKKNPVAKTIKELRAGKIGSIKGLGGFHLAVDATNPQAVAELRNRKFRFEKPLALMVKDVQTARNIAHLDHARAELLQSSHRPIVLCPRRDDAPIAASVSLDNNWLGIMLPYTPLHALLFDSDELVYLVMTSANISEEPICYQNDECFERMANIADFFLAHDREINIRCDDSVQHIHNSEAIFLRRSRGYAPRPVILKESGTPVLAVGAHLKNTICITRNNFAFISQHIGDLENLATLGVFEQTITHLQRINEVTPGAVIHDLHPGYLSTNWASEKYSANRYGIQHHYAHILSVMAEYGINEQVIGVALDGTGYGLDQTVWGGEILLCDRASFTRGAHFEHMPMPGGEKAIKEPWRMATGLILTDEELDDDIANELFPEKQVELPLIKQMIEKKINSPLTSSCGRLFDAAAALLGIRDSVSYEAQAAIQMEYMAQNAYTLPAINIGEMQIIDDGSEMIISPAAIIQKLVHKKRQGANIARLCLEFHLSLIGSLVQVNRRLRDKHNINKVALSGGCFQNMILLHGLERNLESEGFQVYINRQVPANDGGISLGQAYWGMHNCPPQADE